MYMYLQLSWFGATYFSVNYFQDIQKQFIYPSEKIKTDSMDNKAILDNTKVKIHMKSKPDI